MSSGPDFPMPTGIPAQLDQQIPGGFPENESIPAFSSQRTLSEALHARRAEFTRPHTVRIKIGTWNVAAKSGTEKDIEGWFVNGKGVEEALTGLSLDNNGNAAAVDTSNKPERESVEAQEERRSKKHSTIPKNDHGSVPGDDQVDIYALGLQEIVDISSATQALRPYADNAATKKYKDALEAALPPGYELVAEQQLIGLQLLIYAAPNVVKDIRCVSTTSVGTGLMGYMGNKGATAARLILGETTRIVFVNCHMSAGVGKTELERRNWDAQQIIARTKFDPVVDSLGVEADHGEKIGDEDFAFWFGDLNYRLQDIPGDDVRRLLMLHTRNEYDVNSKERKSAEDTLARDIEASQENSNGSVNGNSDVSTIATGDKRVSMQSTATWDTGHDTLDPHDDPASLQTTIASLLPHDELHQQQKSRKAFEDGWQEGPVTFLPTYKYDVGSVGVFDSSEKRRAPSWCDRILFRTRNDRNDYSQRVKDEEESKKRDAYMKSQGINDAAEDEDTLFEYDPDADGDDGDEEAETSATGLPATTTVTKEGYEDILALEYYISHQRVLSSDHKPLDAIFTLKYDAVIPDLKAKVHQEVAKDLDRAENEGRPILTVAIDHGGAINSGVDFGPIRFGESIFRHVTIANTGQVRAEFGFVHRPIGGDDDFGASQKWLSTQLDIPAEPRPKSTRRNTKSADDWTFNVPDSYLLDPGDTCTIELVVHVKDDSLLKSFNKGEKMDDVLILRVKEGRDHFIPIHGTWLDSSFGRSIDSMCRVPEGGIRNQKRKSASTDSENNVVIWSAPREVFRLTESIEKLTERVLAEWSMRNEDDSKEPPWVVYAGWPFVTESWASNQAVRQILSRQIREAIDLDEELNQHLSVEEDAIAKIEAIAETLLHLLASLEDGVVPEALWLQLEEGFFSTPLSQTGAGLDDQRARILEILASSRNHSVSFVLLTSMMAHVAQEVAGAQADTGPSLSRANSDLPASPKVQVSRKSLHSDPLVARRQLVRKNFAAVFAPVMVRVPESTVGKSKTLALEHARKLIEIFLETNAG